MATLKKCSKRQPGLYFVRSFNHRIDIRRGGPGHNRGFEGTTGSNPQFGRQYYYKFNRWRFLRDARGFVLLEFLIVFLIMAFLTFGGVDYWVILTKHQYAEHLVNYYLQRMEVEGYLSIADENDLMARFNAFSCPVQGIQGQRQSQGAARVLRNPADLDASTVSLQVTCRPEPQPLLIGRIIGGIVPGGFTIKVGGSALSERVSP